LATKRKPLSSQEVSGFSIFGVCQAIHPSRKSLSLLIVKGNTG